MNDARTPTQHSPAPWVWWTSNSWKRLKHDSPGLMVNVLEPYVCRDGHPDVSVSEADMALIAAAPELLEALEDAADMFSACADECAECDYGGGSTGTDGVGGICEACAPLLEAERRAREVIAKAEGRT